MAESETAWTKPLPTADGDYFSRIDEYDKSPTLIRVENGAVYEMGQGGNLVREYAAEDYEYLGPFTPSDFEQLTRLRNDIEEAREVIEGLQTFWIDQGDSNPVEWHWCNPDADCSDECQRTRALFEQLAQRRTGEQS